MKLQGGYCARFPGRPVNTIRNISVPGDLRIDLFQHGLHFVPAVKDGDEILFGMPMAWAEIQGGRIALPAPATGTVSVSRTPKEMAGMLALQVTDTPMKPHSKPVFHAGTTAADLKGALACSGIWPLIWSRKTVGIPALDDTDIPRRIVVNGVVAEPFRADSSTLLEANPDAFICGLRFLARLLDKAGAVHLVLPERAEALAQTILSQVMTPEWLRVESMPPRYPAGHPRILCRSLCRRYPGIRPDDGIWVLDVQAVQAIGEWIDRGLPLHERRVAVGGPGSAVPDHRRVRVGTGLERLLTPDELSAGHLILRGGLFQGTPVEPASASVGFSDDAFFVLPRPGKREFLGFVAPGFDRVSILPCFATTLTGALDRHLTSSLRGERRPCVACGLCESVCPMGLMPQVLHRYLYCDAIDEANRTGLSLCIGCGLCSYVCPSKIELTHQFAGAQKRLCQD